MAPTKGKAKSSGSVISRLRQETKNHRIYRKNLAPTTASRPISPQQATVLQIQRLCHRLPHEIIPREFWPREEQKILDMRMGWHHKTITRDAEWPLLLLDGIQRLAERGLTAPRIWEYIHAQLELRRSGRGRHCRYKDVEGIVVGDVLEALKQARLDKINNG